MRSSVVRLLCVVVGTAIVISLGLSRLGHLNASRTSPITSTSTALPSVTGVPASPRTPTPGPVATNLAPDAATSTPVYVPQDRSAELKQVIASLNAGSVSVAALNLKTGAQISGGSTSGQWMASTYKLFLVEALLAANTSFDKSDAVAAIEHSDNEAGYELYRDLGSTSGTVAAFRRFGLLGTNLPSNAYDPTFTTTSATDWIRILRSLVTPGQLTESQRSYIRSLMEQVQPDQRWGIRAAATGNFLNKNGWETVDGSNRPPEPSDGGRWIVNSVGILTIDEQQVLMAVLTQHNPSLSSGINLVEKLAKLAGDAVAPPS